MVRAVARILLVCAPRPSPTSPRLSRNPGEDSEEEESQFVLPTGPSFFETTSFSVLQCHTKNDRVFEDVFLRDRPTAETTLQGQPRSPAFYYLSLSTPCSFSPGRRGSGGTRTSALWVASLLRLEEDKRAFCSLYLL